MRQIFVGRKVHVILVLNRGRCVSRPSDRAFCGQWTVDR